VTANGADTIGWERLRHGGLLLDPPRLRSVVEQAPAPLPGHLAWELRRRVAAVLDDSADVTEFVAFTLERLCGFDAASGTWLRGAQVGKEWSRRAVTGELVRPRQLWRGAEGGTLPVFLDDEARLGIGRGRRAVSHVVQWLRGGEERLALLTNGRQWRLIFAALDFDAWCEWDLDLWLEEGEVGSQVTALRTLLQPALWTPVVDGRYAPLLQAILDSRKGQADLSAVLGERVREAVELLVQAHGEPLRERCAEVASADIYRAAVRMVMRMVVVLFAESRELLPRENALYHASYGLTGLIEELQKAAAHSGGRLRRSYGAWPRVLALCRLVYEGSHHAALPVPAYGGELFASGDPASADGLSRTLALFETGCFEHELLVSDYTVHRMLELITRTRVKVRQGRGATWMAAPVDFSDLSSEYIGILYEGLLDFELKTAPPGDPVVFLAVGNQPALPLSRLEAMDDRALVGLLEKMKDTSTGGADEADEGDAVEEEDEVDEAGADEADAQVGGTLAAAAEEEPEDDGEGQEADGGDEEDEAGEEAQADERHVTRTRAEEWARRAVIVGKLVRAPRGGLTPEKRLAHEDAVACKAHQLVTRVVLPGEWYLVRWGGTRKGAGTFYTRPGLAVPTVQRTLRPLAYDPPQAVDGAPATETPPSAWTPKRPEEILALKVCDPACGSGTFPVAALRFLTEALYESLHVHRRIQTHGNGSLARLFEPSSDGAQADSELAEEALPCRPDDDAFEPRLKAVLRRHVVERCIYGVDLDPLAVELCRLSLWIETMDRSLPFSFLDHKVKCGNSLVGAWFDTFRHYPVMAFKNREGGDKGHGNGVHFAKDARGKALKAFVKSVLTLDLRDFIVGQLRTHDRGEEAAAAERVHDEALATLARLHELPVQDTAERARIYRDELLGSPAYRQLKSAMDLWCACWFWPADRLDEAPLPTTLAAPPESTAALVARIAAEKRFFHWELEFPDVFRTGDSGFDGILGNPPWDIAKPNSKEFFSNIDPLYRSYGKQEALRYQTGYFADEAVERSWLDYNADFRAQSNLMRSVADPFGDPQNSVGGDRFAIARGGDNATLHGTWRDARRNTRCYADPRHVFRHQGSADINLYKAFLEQAHALLRPGGRLGFIVPSGLYSDHGTGGLRALFLDHCRWEWLFGFENRDKVFDIDSRFKFNPVVIEKGGRTQAIRTAFMRRALEDWERAEELAVPYSREQVERFSPRSKAILEIQSARDLEILEKIYANSVLLGDDGPDGWGVRYAREFDMTNDSKLFPPRPVWEAKGYRPDEYSRWLKGDWRPIEELWAELGIDVHPGSGGSVPIVNPKCIVPAEIELEDWLFDTSAGPERRMAEARFVHGHLLKPGDVQRTPWRLRCAQLPYDSLPIPRVDIPAGIILSREADAWIREDRIEDTALPLYEGRMIGQFDFSQKGWVSGKGRSAVWRDIPWDRKVIEPQYLMACRDYLNGTACPDTPKMAHMRVGSATNERSAVAAVVRAVPTGDTAAIFYDGSWVNANSLAFLVNSFAFDYVMRLRLGGLHMDFHVYAQNPLPTLAESQTIGMSLALGLAVPAVNLAPCWLNAAASVRSSWRSQWAVSEQSRVCALAACDAVALALYGLNSGDAAVLLANCDWPTGTPQRSRNPKGFWRVDKDKDPELRHTVLTLVAVHDLQEKIRAHAGDRDAGIEAFLGQNQGEGWMLPETLRLADYGLGHDERAKCPQPVASRLGPRFYDWQLTQSAEESWRECHLHARNLLGEVEYRALVERADAGCASASPDRTSVFAVVGHAQESLW